MKKIVSIFLLFICATVILSCKKESADVSTLVDVSYPTITLKGDSLLSINKGQAYTDAGAVLKDDLTGATTDIQPIDGEVDVNTPGGYTLTYRASNANGFRTTVTRSVIVFDPAPDTRDLSGTYKRGSNVAHVVKVGPRTYTIDNATGYTTDDPHNLFVKFYNYEGDNLIIPLQKTSSGITAQSIDDGTAIITDNGLQWAISASDFFGTALRVFIKQ